MIISLYQFKFDIFKNIYILISKVTKYEFKTKT